MKFDKDKLIKTTKQIFHDCTLPNGAIVAAPVHQEYYPKNSISYLYVWPGRDLGFALAAMMLIGEDHYDKALTWIWDRAEDFQYSPDPTHDGLLFRNYHANGRIYLHYLQPDQNGTLIWSIWFKHQITGKPLSDLEEKIVNKAASALCRIWNKDHFTLTTEDLWEEVGFKPGEGLLTYSVASCAIGLEKAYEMTGNKLYQENSLQMKDALDDYCWFEKGSFIPRRFGKEFGTDKLLDASMSGLVWPFDAGLPKDHLVQTLENIENELLTDHGVHRYPEDKYEGSQGDWHNHKNEEAGTWPLLTFWLSIAWHELGDENKAEKYFDLVFENIGDDYFIPEQIFCCETVPWVGVKPLLWSNSMAIIAAHKLGRL